MSISCIFSPELNVPDGKDDPDQCDQYGICKPVGSFRDEQANEFSKIAVASGKYPGELFSGIYYAYEYLQGEIDHDNEHEDTSILGSMAGLFQQVGYISRPKSLLKEYVFMYEFGSKLITHTRFNTGELQLILLLTLLLEKPVYLRFHDAAVTHLVTFRVQPGKQARLVFSRDMSSLDLWKKKGLWY